MLLLLMNLELLNEVEYGKKKKIFVIVINLGFKYNLKNVFNKVERM